METKRISVALTPETIRYLDHYKSRGKFTNRGQVIETVLTDAIIKWENQKDIETDLSDCVFCGEPLKKCFYLTGDEFLDCSEACKTSEGHYTP